MITIVVCAKHIAHIGAEEKSIFMKMLHNNTAGNAWVSINGIQIVNFYYIEKMKRKKKKKFKAIQNNFEIKCAYCLKRR